MIRKEGMHDHGMMSLSSQEEEKLPERRDKLDSIRKCGRKRIRKKENEVKR